MTQQTLDLAGSSSPDQAARRAMEERMVEVGIRPPTRYDVRPEDLAPPVPTRSRFAAFIVRVTRLFR
jgi:hypothetical protein